MPRRWSQPTYALRRWTPTPGVRLINPNNSGYRKVAFGTKSEHILEYLDTGSEFNIITLVCVQRMPVSGIRPTITLLRGFGGGSVTGVGEITLGVTIDGWLLI